MVFSSITFVLYFLPLFFLFYFLVDKRHKNAVILAGSMLFYSWGAPQFLFVILGTTIIDFYVVRKMCASGSRVRRKSLLLLSVSINLGLLFYFKYAGFFVSNVNHFLSGLGMHQLAWTEVVLPIGISFYTFETITYVVDTYRGKHAPLRNFADYLMYIILFPKLIAGPIIQFHEFAEQIKDHIDYENYENRLKGFYRFVIGLSKKVIIANTLGAVANQVFDLPYEHISTVTAWVGAISYTFQIYFDFSGYSDMALGIGLMMGFRLPENFNNPYVATSITDFWRRWHITLGSWMRNYLYIPLGGNRASSKWRVYFNLWLVFLASGLWHGAAWAFVFWGAYHGFFLVVERMFLGRWLAKVGRLSILYCFPVVLIGWVFFRIEYVRPSVVFLSRMFTPHAANNLWFPDGEFLPMLCIAFLFSFITVTKWGLAIQQKVFYDDYPVKRHYLMTLVVVVLLLVSLGRITVGNFNPFIYFRF